MLATITPTSFTAGAQEVNHLTLTADADWLTYNEEVPHQTIYLGAFNPDFLKSLKVSFTGDENNHLTKMIITGDIAGSSNGSVDGALTGPIELLVTTVLGDGTAEGPFEGAFIGAVNAAIDAELNGIGTMVLGEPSPDATDATSQVDVEFSLLDAIRSLPEGTAIVPLSAASVAELLAIPTTIAGDYSAKALLGAGPDLASLAALEGILAALGISSAIAASSGDVTVDVGDKDDTVDLATFDHNATVLLGDGNDTLKLGLGNDTVQGGNGDDTFIFTPTGTTTTQALNGGPGADMIQIDGTPGDDIFTFSMGGVGNKDLIIKVSGDGPGTPVTTSIIPNFADQSIEQIVVAGNFGDDKFIVDDSHGAIPTRLTFQAGGGEDHLQLVGDPGANGFTVKSENLDFGSVPTFGGIHELVMEDAAGNDVTQTIIYDGFDLNSEFIEDSLPGPLQIQSNYSSSTVVIGGSTESPDPANPDFASIAVGVYGPIKFKNKTRLVYNGGIAGDGIAIDAESLSKSNPNLTSFIVNCGAGDDSVDVTSAPGANLHIIINGNGGDDVLSGDADLHGGDGDDTLTGGDGNYVIDGGGDDDTLQISGSDAVSLGFTANTLTLSINAQTDIYQLIDLENISLTTGGDNDDVVVTNLDQYSGGLAMDLGDGFDRVTYISTTTHILLSDYPSAVFSGAPSPGSGIGRLSLDDVATTFANAEEVDLGGSGQTVDYRAPDDGNSIHVLGMGATTELRLNADAKVVLKNNPTRLNLSGLTGEDTFIIDPNAGTSLTEINITGNDFHSNDEVVLNGRITPDALNYTPGADFGSGNVKFNAIDVNFKFIEGLSFHGQGGADAMTLTTPAGNTVVSFTPGADANSGSLKLRQGGELLGFSYVNVNGATTTLSVANSGGQGDSLIVDGTNDDDVFTVAAVAGGSVRLGNPALPNPFDSVLINTPGVARLELHGGDGDDIFNIPGNHSYAGFPGVPAINIQGGNPSASDVLNFNGAGGAIAVELGPNTVQEAAFGPVAYTGVERVNIQSALTSSLAVNGTAGEEILNFKMNASGQGTFTAVSDGPFVATYPVFTYLVAPVSVIGINTQGGNDTLDLIATTGNDVINVIQSAANTLSYTQNAFTQAFNVSNLELAKVDALAGNDTIRISVSDTLIATPNNSLTFSVDGGSASVSDRLIVNDDDKGDLTILRQAPDQRSGSATVGTLNPVFYTNIARFDITPLNPVTGGVGSDAAGRTVVFHSDPLEYNETRLTAATLSRVRESATPPTIDPGAVSAPFSVPGDEDWYDFRPQATGTFAVKILFDTLPTLANGRAGLPGNGDLNLDIYDANGVLIVSGSATGGGKVATFGATNDPAFSQFNHIYVRVRGTTPNSLNHYEFDNLDAVGTGNPGVGNVDVFGPQVTDVQVNSVPSATYNLFNSKDAHNALHPTPLTNSLLISFQDLPLRAPGFVYRALDPTTATTPGTYVLKGDATGIIAISSVNIEPGTNLPPGVGGLATGQVRLVFAHPLPDDRFTLTINDTLLDPAGNKLDGESNAAEPNGAPHLPSGNTVSGGNFVARFTVDTRVELGAYSSGSVYVDTNGNYSFDPTNPDATNRDITYQMGLTSDNIFAGNFVKALGGTADGFDKLAAYGKVGTNYRWIIDVNNDGVVNAADVNVIQPLFAGVTNIGGTPVAGNFDGNAANGDEVALKVGNTWLLDKVGHDFVVETKLPGTNMVGLPIVGDFDNDGIDDLGSWADDKFSLNLSTLGPIDGTADRTFTFGFAGVRERPVAGDFDGDNITDLGLWVPDRAGVAPSESAEWYLFLSGGSVVGRGGIAGQGQTILDRLNSPTGVVFTPTPFGHDMFAQFGDEFGLPVPGNFDPPITPAQQDVAFDSPPVVQNAPPDAGVIGPSTGVRGQPLSYQVTATDSDIADMDAGLSVVVNWGDGSPTESYLINSTTPQPLSLVHGFVASNTYTITVTATDQNGGTNTETQTISITAVAIQDDPAFGGKMLVVGGTQGNDQIVLNPSQGVKVLINGKSQGNFAPTSRVVVYGQDGNDNIQVADGIRLPAWLFGGNGNDRLKGGKGNDFLFGGAGNDNLLGGQGNDLLVGDVGADQLVGEAGNDALIAGSVSATLTDSAIKSFLDAWAKSAKSATDNGNLRNSLGVTEDGNRDKLTGSAGVDGFFYQAGVDVATDLDNLAPSKPKQKKK